MKQILSVFLLAFVLASAGLYAQEAQEAQEEEAWWESDDDFWTEEELNMFESDNWAKDGFGQYDNDFVWESEDEEEFDTWYEEAENDWTEYDDAGDTDWFDV